MFNFWRPYPLLKPRKSGFYLCTVRYLETNSFVVEKLHYSNGKWTNKSRQLVFEGYKVYKLDRATIEENHVYSDILSELPDETIAAWKKLPRAYDRRKKKVQKR